MRARCRMIGAMFLVAAFAVHPALAGVDRFTVDVIEREGKVALSWQTSGCSSAYVTGIGETSPSGSARANWFPTGRYSILASCNGGLVVASRAVKPRDTRGVHSDWPVMRDFRFPYQHRTVVAAMPQFLDLIRSTLQDRLELVIYDHEVPGERVYRFITEGREVPELTGEDGRARRLAYLVDVRLPATPSDATIVRIQTAIQMRYRMERTWRTEDDQRLHRAQTEKFLKLLKAGSP